MKAIKITKCMECPYIENGRLYSLDGFDLGRDVFCGKNHKELMGFVERTSELEAIGLPEWCPLEDYQAANQEPQKKQTND